MNKTNRIHSLDYLRGLAAFSIMIYHFLLFGNASNLITYHFDISGFLERTAFYGVSVFYILSGLTLYLVYQNKDFSQFNEWKNFFKKRLLRILPLFFVVTTISFILSKDYSLEQIKIYLLNITGLFSVFAYDQYLATGGWSIGNELFFYLIFPFTLYFITHKKTLFWGLATTALISYLIFAYIIFEPSYQGNWWKVYINPLNQVFLFLAGIIMGYLVTIRTQPAKVILYFLLSLSLFIFYPLEGNFFKIISSHERIIFTLISIFIVYAFFSMQFSMPKLIDKPLYFLGEISYGIYLIHPLVFRGVVALFRSQLSFFTISVISMLITLIISYLSYISIERFFINLGKQKKIIHK